MGATRFPSGRMYVTNQWVEAQAVANYRERSSIHLCNSPDSKLISFLPSLLQNPLRSSCVHLILGTVPSTYKSLFLFDGWNQIMNGWISSGAKVNVKRSLFLSFFVWIGHITLTHTSILFTRERNVTEKYVSDSDTRCSSNLDFTWCAFVV